MRRKKRKKEGSLLILKYQAELGSDPSGGSGEGAACLLHGLFLLLWVTAYVQWLNEMLTLELPWLPVVLAVGIACAVLEAAVRLQCVWRAAGAGLLGLLVFIWLKRDALAAGLDIAASRAASVISAYYHIELNGAGLTADTQRALLTLVVLGLFLVLAVGVTTVKWRIGTVPSVLSLLILTASLAVDCFPSILTVAILAAAAAGLLVMTTSGLQLPGGMNGRMSVKSGLYTVGMLLLVCAVSYFASAHFVAERMHGYYDAIKAYPQQMISAAEQFLSGRDSGMSPLESLQNLMAVNFLDDSGRLSSRGPVQSQTVALEVSVRDYPEQPLYLKNFAGTSYDPEQDQWQAVEEASLEDAYETWSSAGLWTYAEAKEALAQQLYLCMEESGRTEQVVYGVTRVGALDNCTWAPYGIDSSQLEMIGDGIYETSLSGLFPGYPLPDSLELLGQLPTSWMDDARQELLEDYSRYVTRTYLEVPEGMTALEAAYEELYAAYGELSAAEWVRLIQDTLADTCVYAQDGLESPSADSNLIDDFFGRQKRGYCIHFASAGAMLLRMAGIPARYVTGYVAWPGDFSYDSETQLYQAEITGYRGHAWVEIYDETAGVWLPVDMTPADSIQHLGDTSDELQSREPSDEETAASDSGSETGDESETQAVTSESEMPASGSEAEADSLSREDGSESVPDDSTGILNGSGQDNSGQGENSSGKTDDPQSDAGSGSGYLWFLLMVIAAAAAGSYIYIRRRRGQPQNFSRVNRSKALLSMEWHLAEVMERAGWKPEAGMDDWAYAAWVQEKVDGLEEGEYLYFMEKLHQAAYSEEPLTEEEYQRCREIYQKILARLQEDKKGIRH